MYPADLHIHSKYSRATSREADLPHLDLWARYKGIGLVGTGDFTHPKWREEMREMLEEAGDGLYRLKKEYRLPCRVESAADPLFVLSGEISTIYKREGKTRKVHHVFLLPGLNEAEDAAHRLEAVGNLHSDGRPILGMDSRDLLETMLEACPDLIYIPAHIWTPHFSLFGAFSGFDSIEECFGDLTPHVRALETGLSSDPPMNRLLSALDGHPLVSNSDAHSPQKLGREANLLSCAPSFPALKRALDTGDGLEGTIEFYPEEGKYHLDGHRNCHCRLTPEETAKYGGVCPVCGKKVTIGVLHRVEQLADRTEPAALDKPFESLMPLPEVIGETLGTGAESKKAQEAYFSLLETLGSEFAVLRERSLADAEAAGGPLLAEGLRRLRTGQVSKEGGYDGEYGVIRLFGPGEREALLGQTALFPAMTLETDGKKAAAPRKAPSAAPAEAASVFSPNAEQEAAVRAREETVAVIAGPGTGKTGTLVRRIAYLIRDRGVPPREITAVTFTRQAAREMTERLEKELGKAAVRGLTVGTFHAVCLGLIDKKPLIGPEDAREIMEAVLSARGEKMPADRALALVSAARNGKTPADLPPGLTVQYQARLDQWGVRDLDGILLDALRVPVSDKRMLRYLLVDEFQDLNAAQRALVRHWSEGRSLFVIGDPDQSIYGFRGADAGCFDDLMSFRPDARVIRLTKNYRSSPAVLSAAAQVISHNPGGDRTLIPTRPEGPRVRLIRAADEEGEGVWIAKEIARLAGGVDMREAKNEDRPARAFSDIAVLCRTNRQAERLERYLNHDGIPCVVHGRGDSLSSDPVRALTGFFFAMLDPGDLPSLSRALRGLFRVPDGLIQRTHEALSQSADPEHLKEALADFPVLGTFLDAWEELLSHFKKEKPRRLLEKLAERTGTKGKAVEQLLNTAVFFPDMPALLDALRMGEDGDISRLSGGKASGAVRLMTLHAAKGLEFPAVILAGVEKGLLPQEKEDSDPEEERRLFFVGITRAKEELILTCGGDPSPFLSELPTDVETHRLPARPRPAQVQQLSLF